ncbi:MAG: MGMT family protein [Verrucomicrobiota bacterium]
MDPNREPTRFEHRVYQALQEVPEGRVTTYKFLGKAVGCDSSQAIGQAMKRNPFVPEVPCHRVIKSDLTIGGYAGKSDGEKRRRKLELLAKEGVRFDEGGRLIEEQRLFDFS